jgi:hypothetical protein
MVKSGLRRAARQRFFEILSFNVASGIAVLLGHSPQPSR